MRPQRAGSPSPSSLAWSKEKDRNVPDGETTLVSAQGEGRETVRVPHVPQLRTVLSVTQAPMSGVAGRWWPSLAIKGWPEVVLTCRQSPNSQKAVLSAAREFCRKGVDRRWRPHCLRPAGRVSWERDSLRQ